MQEIKQRNGLYSLLFKRLNEIRSQSQKEIIPFPVIFEKLCRNFSMSKKECWEILFLLNDTGLIEIVTLHGVKIKLLNFGE